MFNVQPSGLKLYFNTTPDLSGSPTLLQAIDCNLAAPQSKSFTGLSQSLNVGIGYLLIAVDIDIFAGAGKEFEITATPVLSLDQTATDNQTVNGGIITST